MIDEVLSRPLLPDAVLRWSIRRVVAARLREQTRGGQDGQARRFAALVAALRDEAIAVTPEAANQQHYEVSAAFFACMLGPHLKYSCGWWPPGTDSLEGAEARMLELTTERAAIGDGQAILDLGCGWGALSLHLARRFPHSAITAVSNSASQRAYIAARAAAEGLANVRMVTADINRFEPAERFDRIVSVEMLEHVRNHRVLFGRLARWLQPDGRVFAHVFAHRRFAYTYESRDASDWISRYFFTGGLMPSDRLFRALQDDLTIERHWTIDGRHYERTANAWLRNLDARGGDVRSILEAQYGAREAERWRRRWRVFLMACAEMFGYRDGAEWGVSHYLFSRRTV